MLYQSDIKAKKEPVYYLQDNEYIFMRKKINDMISALRVQLVETQKQKDVNMIRQDYKDTIEQLNTKIQEIFRKFTHSTFHFSHNQNELALKSNVHRLETENKILAQTIRTQDDLASKKILKQEQIIQHLQRRQAQSDRAKERLEREYKEQKTILKKRNEEILASTNQLNKMVLVVKKAVREGGVLDEKMLVKIAPILGGQFTVMARAGGHGFTRKKNPIPLSVRVSRKKQFLDRALSQYVYGKQALVEMKKNLVRRKELVHEKNKLEEERMHYVQQATGRSMDTMAIELMDERVDFVSKEISCLSAKIHDLQKEAEEDNLHADIEMSSRRQKRVVFVDDIINGTDQDAQQDNFDEQFRLPVNAAPEIAYKFACKLIKSFEADECQTVIKGLMDDIMELKMSNNERQSAFKSMEETIAKLTQILNDVKKNKQDTRFISLPNSPIASPFSILENFDSYTSDNDSISSSHIRSKN
ncbi:unnamed protein product [Rhizopus stolonifer]